MIQATCRLFLYLPIPIIYGMKKPEFWLIAILKEILKSPLIMNTGYRTVQRDMPGTVPCAYMGNASKFLPQRSLRLESKRAMGSSRFDYNFFNEGAFTAHDDIILKNAGQDWAYNFIRDAFCSVIAERTGSLLTNKYQPCQVFLNGQYYGMMNLRSRTNTEYLSDYYNIDESTITLIEGEYFTEKQGSKYKFLDMLEKQYQLDINSMEGVEELNKNIDLDNFFSYVIIENYFGNVDWLKANTQFWQSDSYDGRWRWFLHDMDLSIGLNFSARDMEPDHPFIFNFIKNEQNLKLPELFNYIMNNDSLKKKFINRVCDLLNTDLNINVTSQVFDSLNNNIEKHLPKHQALWPESCADFDANKEHFINWIRERQHKFLKHVQGALGKTGVSALTLETNDTKMGYVALNSIEIHQFPWQGNYIQDVPLALKAIAKPGYIFDHWEQFPDEDEEIMLNLSGDFTLKAVFRKEYDDEKTNIVINEILYKPNEDVDSEDWIELINNGKKSVNLRNWYIKDNNEGHIFTIEEDMIIEPDSLVILCRDKLKFREVYSGDIIAAGDISFGFGAEDMVRLYNPYGYIQDSVSYSDVSPWPIQANCGGYSIELTDPDKDNSLAESWKLSAVSSGSPGKGHLIQEGINSALTEAVEFKVFPNPCSSIVNISLNLNTVSEVQIAICDIFGNIVFTGNINPPDSQGNSNCKINTEDFDAGLYYIHLKAGKQKHIGKFVKL